MKPYFTIVGNLTLDVIGENKNPKPGGPGLYAGLAAIHLGYPVRIISSIGIDYPSSFLEKLRNLNIDLKLNITKGKTTTFKLIYQGGEREVILLEPGPKIIYDLIEDSEGLILVSPVYREVSIELVKELKKKSIILGIDLQGFVRRVRNGGVIEFVWDDLCEEVIKYADVIHIEESEARGLNEDPLEVTKYISKKCECVVSVTMGDKGSYLAHENNIYYVPVPKVYVGNLTGVGDVFTAILILRYYETKNAIEAVKWATIAAGLKVMRSNSINWFTRSEVELLADNVMVEKLSI